MKNSQIYTPKHLSLILKCSQKDLAQAACYGLIDEVWYGDLLRYEAIESRVEAMKEIVGLRRRRAAFWKRYPKSIEAHLGREVSN